MTTTAPSPCVQGTEAERTTPRTNLFLMATALVDGSSRPVRVRNLSASGALIEGANLPLAGSALVIKRGNLSSDARMIWLEDRRGGVEFASPIDLANWIPGAPPRPHGQVDPPDIGARDHSRIAVPDKVVATIDQRRLLDRVAEEIAHVARNLETLGDDLANEPALVVRYAAKLRQLDVSVHTLGHIGRLLATADPAAALTAIGMDELRRRLVRAAPL